MVARWITRLSPFDYVIEHKAGKLHGNADGLSRRQCRPCKRDNCPECLPLRKPIKSSKDSLSIEEIKAKSILAEKWEKQIMKASKGSRPVRSPKIRVPTKSEVDSQAHGASEADANEVIDLRAFFCESVSSSNDAVDGPGDLVKAFKPSRKPVKEKDLEEIQIPPWDKVTKDEMRALQTADVHISSVIYLKETFATKPSGKDVAMYSSEVRSYWVQWGRLLIKDGLLYRKPKEGDILIRELQLATPKDLRRKFFLALHRDRLAGHQGINKTLAALKLRFYWPKMVDDVTRWCSDCHTCRETKPLSVRHKSALQQSVEGSPFDRIAIDLMGPFEATEDDHNYILVIQDYFTKWVIAEPLVDKTSATVADAVFLRWITQYGCPGRMHSDQGCEFTSALFKEVCALLRIEKTVTSAARPQSDGMVERSNRSLQAMLKAYVNDNRDDWDDHLPAVVCAYRATPHDSTGISPYKMLFGREMAMPIDLQFDLGNRALVPSCPVAYVEWLRQSLQNSHDFARDQLVKSALRQKKNYQDRSRDVHFKRGDWVWKVMPQLRPGKLYKKNEGPWLVLARTGPVNYRIQRRPKASAKVVHVDKLSQYHPDEGEELTSWLEALPREIATQTELAKPSSVDNETQYAFDDCQGIHTKPDVARDIDPSLGTGSLKNPCSVDPALPVTVVKPKNTTLTKTSRPSAIARPKRVSRPPVRFNPSPTVSLKKTRGNNAASIHHLFEGLAGLLSA